MIPHFKTANHTVRRRRSTVVGTVTSLRANDPEFDTWLTQQLYLFSKFGRTALGPLSLLLQLVNTYPSQKSVPPQLDIFWTHPGLVNFAVLTTVRDTIKQVIFYTASLTAHLRQFHPSTTHTVIPCAPQFQGNYVSLSNLQTMIRRDTKWLLYNTFSACSKLHLITRLWQHRYCVAAL
jgi:hypothetical protein